MNQPIDEPIFYGDTLSISLWMILATIVVFLLVGGSRIIIRIYKKYLKDKNRKALLREDLE